MKKIYLFLCSVFTLSFSFAQQGEIKGVTVTGITGVTKSLSEVIVYEKAHPLPPNFVARLRPELEGPEPVGQYPRAIRATRYGTLVSPSAALTSSVSTTSSQPAFSNFLAIWGNYGTAIPGRESPYTPPDNCGDVGFTQVIATANTRMKVFTKPSVTGTPSTTPTGSSTTTLPAVVNVDLNVFFANSSLGITGISDPHVRFDRLTGRWFIVAIDVDHRTNNYCCIAVSDPGTLSTSSIFKIYYFSVSQTGGSSRDFFDYPTLGVDQNSLYIGGNMFRNQSSFSGCSMWVVNKNSIVSGTTMTVTGFHQSGTRTDMYTPQGVHNDDPSAVNGYFIGASQSVYSKLVIRRVSYTGTTPSLSGDLNLPTAATYTPKTVPTLGGTSIDGGDRRLYAAMIKKNKISNASTLWIAQGTRLNSSGVSGSGGDRDGAYWAEIGNLTANPAISQSAMLYDNGSALNSPVYYSYPTIALSGQGHNLMGFTSAGPNKYCQAAAANRYRTDAVATFNAPLDFTTSTSTYNPGASRWGDYTQTVVDPEDDMTMWTFSEYAATTNAWGVRAAQFKAPPPAAPSLASPPCGTPTVTINGTSANNSEFFEPGTSYSKHIGVSVSGPGTITVSNVVFISPTQLTATFNTSGAPAGTYIITIKNPDGQVASTSFSLANCTLVTVSTNPGISENIEASKTIIYPNPVHDVLTIANVKGVNSLIQIFGNNGILLRQIRTASSNYKINVSNLAAGTYTLKIISDNKLEVQKFVKD